MNVHRENETKQSEIKIVLEAEKHVTTVTSSPENPSCRKKGIYTEGRGNQSHSCGLCPIPRYENLLEPALFSGKGCSPALSTFLPSLHSNTESQNSLCWRELWVII